MEIVGINEFWTDSIEDTGGGREIKFHMQVVLPNGTSQWHYYGTPIPQGVAAIAHGAIRFPADFDSLPEQGILYDLARTVAVNKLALDA